jgi:hypothetical protein
MNYNEQARTNYFKVKDKEALERFVELIDAELDWEDGQACILAECGIPPSVTDEETEEDVDINMVEEAKKFLADGEILVLQGNGSEGMRIFTGFAVAFDNKGNSVSLSLDDIYAKAAKKFKVKQDTIKSASPYA